MANSDLRGLYTYLASMPVTFAGEDGQSISVAARDLNALKNSVSSSDLPIRLLLPTSSLEGTGYTAMGMCNGAKWQWSIGDLMLFSMSGAKSGLKDVAADLVRYMDAYTGWVATMKSGLPSTVNFSGCTINSDVYEFPIGSKVQFIGAIANLNFSIYTG